MYREINKIYIYYVYNMTRYIGSSSDKKYSQITGAEIEWSNKNSLAIV